MKVITIQVLGDAGETSEPLVIDLEVLSRSQNPALYIGRLVWAAIQAMNPPRGRQP